MPNHRSPSAVAANVPPESHVPAMGAEPQPGLSKPFSGRREISKKVSRPLPPSESLRATQSPVLVVDWIFNSQRVLIGEEGDTRLGLWQVVQHPSISNALTMRGDRSRRKIGNQTLAVAFIETATASTAATAVRPAGTWMEKR